VVISPEELIRQTPRWLSHGLCGAPLEAVASGPAGSYSTVAREPLSGGPTSLWTAVGRVEDVRELQAAWTLQDHDQIGRLLGYPECCRKFFTRIEPEQEDPTWSMALATPSAKRQGHVVELDATTVANPILRWLGLRLIPHLPCSLSCGESEAIAQRMMACGSEIGFSEEMDWLEEALAWPVEWSALHGIAEVKTPIFKLAFASDATAEKYTVRIRSSSLPVEAATGIRFPFRAPERQPLVTRSESYLRGTHELAQITKPDWYHLENGFSSRAAMDDAHQQILEIAVERLHASGSAVLDLGCGNGALLQKLCARMSTCVPFGVERVAERLQRVSFLLPIHAGNFVRGDFFSDETLSSLASRRYALAILMLGRLQEETADRVSALKAFLRRQCDDVLVYLYDDWRSEVGALDVLANHCRVELMSHHPESRAALANLGAVR
jgi:hypothetical protein